MPNLVATRWVDQASGLWIDRVMTGERVTFVIRRQGGECLNKQGGFEYEPHPSNRDPMFLARCRWDDFDQAVIALGMATIS